MTWLFESIILSKKLYLQNVERLNASWNWIVFESIVSSKDCIRRVIDFQIFSRYTICSKLVRLFVTIKHLSRRNIDMIIRINCFVKWIIFVKRARHRTRHDIDLFSNRLYRQKNCIVVLLIFKYVFVVRFVRNLIISVIVFLSISMFCNWCKNFRCLFLTKFFFFF